MSVAKRFPATIDPDFLWGYLAVKRFFAVLL